MSMKPAARPDESSVQLMETQCAMEREFRRRGKLPWRDAASRRRSSTTNKGPLLSSRVGSQLGFERFALLSEDVPARMIARMPASRTSSFTKTRESGTFSFRSAPAHSEMSILFSQPEEFVSLVASVTADQQSRLLVRSISCRNEIVTQAPEFTSTDFFASAFETSQSRNASRQQTA